MKHKTGFLIFGTAAILLPTLFASIAGAVTNPLAGKLIALDAGHGGSETGAVNLTHVVAEKDVNIDVVRALKTKLEGAGVTVVLTREGDETLPSRKERVQMAMDKCLATALARKCDLLISVHHNGSADPLHNGTLAIYNEKQDIPLATALHDALIAGLGLQDEGYLSGGYGITVYNHLVSALTEAYYITNDAEAERYLAGARVTEEVDAQFLGLTNYFAANSGGKGGRPR